MASWSLIIYFAHKFHSFFVNPHTNYHDLLQMISTNCKILLDNYFIEIYDIRFRCYVILNEEYIVNLQDRLPRTSVSTLNGQIRLREERIRNSLPINRKRKHTSSSSSCPENDYIIIWLDSYIGDPENCRELKHKFHLTTTLDIARPMLDYELCIDDLIQTTSILINKKTNLYIFSNQDECLHFLDQNENRERKILFITSNIFSDEILPLIIKRVQIIYILVHDNGFRSVESSSNCQTNLFIFHDNIHLLVHLIRHLAFNFFEQGQITSKSSTKQGIIFFKWAKKLFNRANEIDHPSDLPILHSIDQQLEILELNDKSSQSDDDNHHDEKFARECDEG